MRKSKLWTLAMALAASLGTSMDIDSGDRDQALREDAQGLAAKANPEGTRDGRRETGREPSDRIRD